jgi:hypothetical protein
MSSEAEAAARAAMDDGSGEERDIHPDLRESGCPHEWIYTGTNYGGDDSRWSGEGRCYCIYCGADGDA